MFYVPLHPSDRARTKAKRAVVVVIAIGSTVAVARIFPTEVGTLANGFREGFTTLLIEHILHHWGEIVTVSGAALAHHFHD